MRMGSAQWNAPLFRDEGLGTDPGVIAALEEFLKRYPRYRERKGAFNKCAIATVDLTGYLEGCGYRARQVWVRCSRTRDLSGDSQAMPSEHALVHLPETGGSVDVTRRQFDATAQVPTLYGSEAELGAHWAEINEDTERREYAWRSLPAAQVHK